MSSGGSPCIEKPSFEAFADSTAVVGLIKSVCQYGNRPSAFAQRNPFKRESTLTLHIHLKRRHKQELIILNLQPIGDLFQGGRVSSSLFACGKGDSDGVVMLR